MAIKGPKLISLKSHILAVDQRERFENYEELQQFCAATFGAKGRAVAYLDYKVLIGKFQEGRFVFYHREIFEPKFLQRLRLFNEKRELYLWRNGANIFQLRLREDEKGEEQPVMEAEQVLWGTEIRELEESWSLLTEARGVELLLPWSSLKVNPQQRVRIKTRNYVAFNEVGQAGYVDSRFVEFCGSGING